MATVGFTMRGRWVSAGVFVAIGCFLSAAAVCAELLLPQPASVPLNPGPDRHAEGAARIVGAILEYTRWPLRRPVLTLCVIQPALHAGRMSRFTLSDGRIVQRRDIPARAEANVTGCDALYLGRLDLAALQRWTRAARGAAIVTIAETDPDCRSEAMFCLRFLPAAISFDLNIDAVSRSGVRVDPRVLRMSGRED